LQACEDYDKINIISSTSLWGLWNFFI
jgi:hypothetical protein